MKNRQRMTFAVALALIAGTYGLLVRIQSHPRLGVPGIKTTPVPGQDIVMKIDLPARVLDFTSTNVPEPAVVSGYLPKDSSYAERYYRSSADGFEVENTAVLMGSDRTSIHNADFCLNGAGWNPYDKKIVDIPIGGARPYSLPVSEWKVSGTFRQPDGTVKVNGVYVFWFVADGEETPSHFDMVAERLPLHLLRTGVLQRWAYIAYFSLCEPGREDATFERMKQLISASVPEFEPPPARLVAAQK